MKENWQDKLFKLWIIISSIIVSITILFIFGFILRKGLGSINLEFITGNPKGIPLGSEGGILPGIIGSLFLMILACAFASILAISTAIYTVFYCKFKVLSDLIHLVIQCMAGVPSIVLGMFAYTLLILPMH